MVKYYFIFFPLNPKVAVWEWQFGHKNLKFSILLSVLSPLIWSTSKLSSWAFHLLIPQIKHLYSIPDSSKPLLKKNDFCLKPTIKICSGRFLLLEIIPKLCLYPKKWLVFIPYFWIIFLMCWCWLPLTGFPSNILATPWTEVDFKTAASNFSFVYLITNVIQILSHIL